jgi:hypothetical protein
MAQIDPVNRQTMVCQISTVRLMPRSVIVGRTQSSSSKTGSLSLDFHP